MAPGMLEKCSGKNGSAWMGTMIRGPRVANGRQEELLVPQNSGVGSGVAEKRRQPQPFLSRLTVLCEDLFFPTPPPQRCGAGVGKRRVGWAVDVGGIGK